MTSGEKITHGRGSPTPKPERSPTAYDIREASWWDGNDLYFRGQLVASLLPDGSYAGLWHVVTPDGQVSGMTNWTRARDAAMVLAARNA